MAEVQLIVSICAELVGRLNFDRNPLSAIALTTNSSNLTCISNDYGYEHVFVRQMEALAQSHDSLIVFYTTSAHQKHTIAYRTSKKKIKIYNFSYWAKHGTTTKNILTL